MFISKFNRLIRNKIVWGIFAVIVAVSFVAFFTPSSGDDTQVRNPGVAGKLNGKPVSDQEFQTARFETFLFLSLSIGRPINLTPELEKELRKETWQRLVAMRAARQMGISISDEQVISAIQRDPMFTANGVFSRAQYDAFARGFLANMGVSSAQFEQFMRSQLMLQHAQNMISAAVWLPPAELEKALRMYSDTFTIDYVRLTPKTVAGTVKVSAQDGRAFFDTHTNLFIVPEQVSVKYVSFPLSNGLAGVEITDKAVTNYYDEHIEEFTSKDTNGISTARDFAEVKDKIRDSLLQEELVSRAREKANHFVDLLTPDRSGRAPSFEKAAAESNLVVRTSARFSIDEPVANLDVGLDFNKVAFDLRPNAEECVGEPVVGESAVYVPSFNEKTDPRLPSFEEVETNAMAMATEQAELDALTKKAGEVHKAIRKALDEGKTFADAAKALALIPRKTKPFTALDAPEGFASQEVLADIISRQQGDLTDVLTTESGIMIGYVEERKQGDEMALGTLRQQVATTLGRRQARMVVRDWQQYLLEKAKLEDPQQIATEQSDQTVPPGAADADI